jgi:hypothetical protein
MSTRARYTLALCLTLALPGCNRDARPTEAAAVAVEAEKTRLAPYPRGRWRLVDPVKLDHVVVWASHILIRHGEAPMADPCFSFANWHSESTAPRHLRREALTIARDLRERAAQHPQQFAELAAKYSEDAATRSIGGSLGGMKISQLRFWPEIVDGLAHLAPGEVSKVIETEYGFHIVQRQAVPREDTVTGRRIVIAHNEAGWLPLLARGEAPFRNRQDALALANDLYTRASADPGTFEQLIDRYSEHRDALRGGDLGTWSNLEPSNSPREVAVLSRLAVGQVAPPLDSPVGFEIIQRVPNREREWYAIEQLVLPFNALAPSGDPASKASVRAQANDLLQQVRRAPETFDTLRSQRCCAEPLEWLDGRGSPALTALLGKTPLGSFGEEPVQSEYNYVIAKRIAPTAAPSAVAAYELPDPGQPDVEFFVRTFDGPSVGRVLRGMLPDIPSQLGLPAETAQRLAALHTGDDFAKLQEGTQKLEAYRLLLQNVSRLLESDKFPEYQALMNRHWEAFIFEQG